MKILSEDSHFSAILWVLVIWVARFYEEHIYLLYQVLGLEHLFYTTNYSMLFGGKDQTMCYFHFNSVQLEPTLFQWYANHLFRL